MCKAIDAAIFMINKSIDYAKEKKNPEYYMDSMKLHKLLYLAQCCMLAKYDEPLFVENVTAHMCGPYIDNISAISAYGGFGNIEKKFKDNSWIITRNREAVMELVLNMYGEYSTEEIVDMTKSTLAYTLHSESIKKDIKPSINKKEMIQTGDALFSTHFDELDILKI